MSEWRRERAFQAGKKAGLSGLPETKNNRQPGTIFFDDWWDGWSEGERSRVLPDEVGPTS